MAKKNNKSKRRKHPLIADPNRQANASLRGYRYQILHSVNAWLDLTEDEVLYLEGVEDFDIISNGTATVVQVKDTQHNISLKSQEVIKTINQYWKSRTENSDRHMKFRFITRSKVCVERDNPFGSDQRGLHLWRHCSGDQETVKKISEFLQNQEQISDEVKDFLKQTDLDKIYKQLIKPMNWETGSPDASTIEQFISDKVLCHCKKYSIPIPHHETKKIVESLLEKAWTVATRNENRKLTQANLLKIFYEKANENVLTWSFQRLQKQEDRATALDTTNTLSLNTEDSSDITIQSSPKIQTDIPKFLLDIVVPRTELHTDILTKLQSDGIVVIHGGAGKGKTTLAKSIANTMNGNWFWLNFTNIEPLSTDSSLQVSQQLKQLAFAIHNESSQVNVVIDDLNLQPQHLQMYEDDLGLVVHRVFERDAKLLITSQHKPPNSLIRSLRVSKAIVVDVPNFTEPEIKQFASEMECPPDDAETWTALIQAYTVGHPTLVHAWLVRLREEGWKEENILRNILQRPKEIIDEQEAARQLLTELPEDQRELLYRLSLMHIGFRRDYALNIAEIPEPISHPGDAFSQLVGPWIDQIDEAYYTISPLLSDAANQVWTESKIKDLHAYIANAILKANSINNTKKLTTMDVWAVLRHSIVGQNRGGLISVIHALSTVPEDEWENICHEFSWITNIKTNPPEELFPGYAFVNQLFRSFQYRIALEVKPELIPMILEIWDKETKPYEPRQSYVLARLMIATEILKYNQRLFPVKRLVGFLREMIDIRDSDKKTWEEYLNSLAQLKEINIDESNFFSFLFSFVYMRPDINVTFLNDLIDALDELDPKIRSLLLADFEGYNIDCRVLIESIYLHEEKQENPNWTRCLQVYDKVIEKSLAWGYPHIAALSARGKAIIHDEYLKNHNIAHQVYQDIILKVGALPVIEEGQAVVYLRHEHYQEALNIYERILPEWHKASKRFDVSPIEEYRRAAICAAYLDDWKKAALFLEDGANKTKEIEKSESYICLYVDAGFAYFKAGRILECIKLLHRALQDFETLPQNNSDLKYFALKKRLEHTIKWIWKIWCVGEVNTSNFFEPYVGFCSDPTINEEILNLPDCPIGYSWLYLSRIEYRFGHETTVLQNALQTTDREEYPFLNYWLSFLEAQYEFRNKIFDNLPHRIFQLAQVFSSMKKHQQIGRGAAEKGSYSISNSDLSNFASVDNIIAIFIAALIVNMRTNGVVQDIFAIWRENSAELPIKEKIYSALNLIEPILLGDYNEALTVMYTQNEKVEKLLAASLRVMHNVKASLEDLLFAHTYMASSFINSPWEDFVGKDLAELLSVQWLEKITFRAKLKTPFLTAPQIEQACKNSETGKNKIGQILIAVHQAVSVKVPLSPEFFQQFRTWTKSKQKQEHEIGKNPAAQRLIKAMEKPPHLTDEDIEVLNQSIKEGEIPIKFDSPFDSDDSEK